jgi:predicted outer membrane repeat protein
VEIRKQSVTTITNCTGAAISQAVANFNGGEVDLDCGPDPVTITVPQTMVFADTVLRAVRPGTITLTTNATEMFEVNDFLTFEIDDLAFVGAPKLPPLPANAAVVGDKGSKVTLVGDQFSNYIAAPVIMAPISHLTVIRSTFTNNGRGAASPFFRAAIVSKPHSFMSIEGSTFSNNSGQEAGAISNNGTLTVSDSTFVNNSSAGAGGAILTTDLNSSMQITNSTFVDNRAAMAGGSISTLGAFGTTIQSCTFFNSDSTVTSGMIAGTGISVFDTILVDPSTPTTPCTLVTGSSNLQWPVGPALCGPGFVNGDPNLGPLASNGGPTQTMAIQLPSAAFRAATAPCPATDQRGVARGTACDIGAYQIPATN